MRPWLATGAAHGFVAVAMGAFAAHGLEGRLSPEALAWIDTGARYQLLHGLALVALAGLAGLKRGLGQWLSFAGWAFALGALVFSGCLYLMALLDLRFLGAVVPLGGLGMLAGWLTLFLAALRGGREE